MYMCMFTEDYERELMLSTHVVFQTTRLTKTLLAHITSYGFSFV